MGEQPQVGLPTGQGLIEVEKVVFPYRAVALTFLLENIGEVRIPLPPDEARRLGETVIGYAENSPRAGPASRTEAAADARASVAPMSRATPS